MIELRSSIETAQDVFSGALRKVVFNSTGPTTSWLRNENIFLQLIECVGATVFWTAPRNHQGYYFDNRDSIAACKMKKKELETVIGDELKVMDTSLG